MQVTRKKVAATLGATAVALAGGGIAFAYWTSTGSGSGTAATGSGTNDLTISSDAVTGLVPGGSLPLSLHVHNDNTTTSEHFGAVSYTVTTSNSGTHDDGTGCDPADFTVTGLPTSGTVAPSSTNDYSSATIAFANTATDQNGCKNVTVTVHYTA